MPVRFVFRLIGVARHEVVLLLKFVRPHFLSLSASPASILAVIARALVTLRIMSPSRDADVAFL